jgi:hypothetical protein
MRSSVIGEVRYTRLPMVRRFTVLLVLFAMVWQAVAMARPGSTVNVMSDLAHAALHWQEQAHHHHDDGSLHLDDSQASVLHVMLDHVTVTNALLPSGPQEFPPGASERPCGPQGARTSAPFIDGLLRPPRLLS